MLTLDAAAAVEAANTADAAETAWAMTFVNGALSFVTCGRRCRFGFWHFAHIDFLHACKNLSMRK